MGVDGLLRQLGDAVEMTHLLQFAGQTLVVDALSWLHKACYGCAFELSTGMKTDKYVHYMLRKVDLLRSCNVSNVILVFDGQRLPLKSLTQEKRQRYKEENRKRALEAMAASKSLQGSDRQEEVNKAYQLFQRMVWMCKEGMAAGIVTEDSDVLVYCLTANVTCSVLVKLEDNGSTQVVSRSILHKNSAKTSCMLILLDLLYVFLISVDMLLFPANALMKKIHFFMSGEKEATRMFVQVCVLAGCDFIDSLPNVGFATAVKHIFQFRGAPSHLRVQRLVAKLSTSGTKVPSDFVHEFHRAETIFFHHIIFNPKKRCCEFLVDEKHINCFPDVLLRAKESLGIVPLEEGNLTTTVQHEDVHASTTKSFLGEIRSREVVEQIYWGKMCARTYRNLSQYPREQQSFVQAEAEPLLSRYPEPSGGSDNAAIVTQRKTLQLSPTMIAQKIENKKLWQANERVTSIQGLRSVYKIKTATETSATNEAQNWSISTPRTRVERHKFSNDGTKLMEPNSSGGSSASINILSTKVKSSKVIKMSMKELIANHSPSIDAAKHSDVDELPLKVGSQSVPGLRKRARPAAKPITSSPSGKKPRALMPKTISSSGIKTLFDFFQRQV
ncbi:hypothetical protein PsorP6_016669 [Peronosclerospora sorghi]|uniref:Uncharacterized protein n=1 Tax=Peronosclerospora sorghi TaxID=230839 RepID=A0ACC0VS38_9STRA|nr:hypothetical protein PsorP6_016669 [Peronosclerospora sorghi]